MDRFMLALIVVGAIAVLQMLYGLIRRAKGLAFIGFVVALLCALAFLVAWFYGDAIFLPGGGYQV